MVDSCFELINKVGSVPIIGLWEWPFHTGLTVFDLELVWFPPLDLPIYADKLLKGENQSNLESDHNYVPWLVVHNKDVVRANCSPVSGL